MTILSSGLKSISIGGSINHGVNHGVPSFNSFRMTGDLIWNLSKGGQLSIENVVEAFVKSKESLLKYYLNGNINDSVEQKIIKESIQDFLNKIPDRFNFNDVKKLNFMINNFNKKNKTLSFEKFIKQKEKQNLKDYRKYLKNKNKTITIGELSLEEKLIGHTNIIKFKLPVVFSKVYFEEYLSLEKTTTTLEKEFKVNKFYKTLTDYREVEKYLGFMKKEVEDVRSAEVDIDNETLKNMKKIVIDGLDNEIQIIEKYCLNLKLNEKMESSFKEKTKKI